MSDLAMKHLIPEFERLRGAYPAGLRILARAAVPAPHPGRPRLRRRRATSTALVEYLGVPRIQIEEVLSFYRQFRRKPIGRWHVAGSAATSPARCGAPSGSSTHLDEEARHRARAQTTADGRFTLSTVECLASCGTAPVLMVNDTYHEADIERRANALDRRSSRSLPMSGPAADGVAPQLLMTFPVTATRTRSPSTARAAATGRSRRRCGR